MVLLLVKLQYDISHFCAKSIRYIQQGESSISKSQFVEWSRIISAQDTNEHVVVFLVESSIEPQSFFIHKKANVIWLQFILISVQLVRIRNFECFTLTHMLNYH